MRVKTVSVAYERKINLGDYNSATIGLSLWADLDEKDDEEVVATALQEQARDLVKVEFLRLKGKVKSPANGTAD
jgi:hypothetical protein